MTRCLRDLIFSACKIAACLMLLAVPAWAAGDDKYKPAQDALERGDFKTALTELDKLLADTSLQPGSRAMVLFNRAQAHIALKELDAALADIQAVVALDPAAADAWINIGAIHQERGQYIEAVGYHRTALQHALAMQTPTPLPIIAHNNLAWLLATCPVENCRDGKAALEGAQTSLDLLQQFPGAGNAILAGHHDTLGVAYAELGDFDKAAEAAQRAIELGKAENPEAAKNYEARLESYRAKKPWRLKTN
jgi:tetratricopeptide (TPR) repeat protein